jgi:hypothetical protein
MGERAGLREGKPPYRLPRENHDAVPDRKGDQTGAVMNIKLLHDIVAVSINRPWTDVQQGCHGSVCVSFRNQLKDFPFT